MAVRICTWEYVTTFDGQPSESQIVKRFSEDFPQVDIKDVVLNLMVSFNSSEGRKLRYMVLFLQENLSKKNLLAPRKLPAQIWMFGWADEYLRGITRNKNDNGDEGNGLFWCVQEGCLYVLVFFEGRLCHWSEEYGYEASLGNVDNLVGRRLQRFQQFLKEDDLFSRGTFFPEIQMESNLQKTLYKRACRDSFWKNIDLGAERKNPLVQKNKGYKVRFVALLLFLMAGALFLCLQQNPLEQGSAYLENFPDASQIELTESSMFESMNIPAETRSLMSRERIRPVPLKNLQCLLPQVRLRGVVAPRLFMAELLGVDKIQHFKMGDSIGNFVVSEIGRNYVEFVCNDSAITVFAE